MGSLDSITSLISVLSTTGHDVMFPSHICRDNEHRMYASI